MTISRVFPLKKMDGLLITCGEDPNITAWDHTSRKVAYCMENCQLSRIKELVVCKNKNNSQNQDSSHILASASSDGVIRTWDRRMITKENPTPLAEANTNFRLTCLAGSSVRHESSFSPFCFFLCI